MKRALIASVVGFVLAVSTAAPAMAAWDPDGEGDTAEIIYEGGGGIVGVIGDDPVYTDPGPWTDYSYTPACDINGPPPNSADVMCGAATMSCPSTPERRETRMKVYTRPMGADNEPTGPWDYKGTECRGADDPPEGGPAQITPQMIFDQAQQVAPKTVVHAEPGTKSYVNVPTNFYADSQAVTETVTVAGMPVKIRFSPSGYQWTYGDGGTGSGVGVKDALVGAPGAVEHVYRRAGGYQITLKRSFAVQFTLPNGQTLDLPVPLSTTSAGYALAVGEIQSIVTNVD